MKPPRVSLSPPSQPPRFLHPTPNAVSIEQGGFGFHQKRALVKNRVHHLFVVKFVGDVTHNFFEDIFEGDDSAGASILVHDDGDVNFLL